MIKRYSAVLLSLWFSLAFPIVATAQTNADVEKNRVKVQTLSADRNQQVEIKFRDKTKVKGYISSVQPVSFTLRDPKTGTTQAIAYSEIEDIRKSSGGVSTKTWLIIGGVAAGVITTWLIVKPAFCDGGAQTRGIC